MWLTHQISFPPADETQINLPSQTDLELEVELVHQTNGDCPTIPVAVIKGASS